MDIAPQSWFSPTKGTSGPSMIGIVVAITGNIIISFALNCQKLAHKRIEEQRSGSSTPQDEESGTMDYGARTNGGVRFKEPHTIGVGGRGGYSNHPQESAYVVQPNGGSNATSGALHFEAHPLSNPAASPKKGKTRMSILSTRSRGLSLTSAAPTPIPEESSQPSTPLHSPSETSMGGMKSPKSMDSFHTELSPLKTQHNGLENSTVSQKRAEFSSDHETDYLQSKLWWIGFLLLNVGEFGNFLSYGFAPASVVAPLGTFALIANCFFAPIMLKEKFHKRDLTGVAISIIGAITVVGASKPKDVRLDPSGLLHAITRLSFIIYASICIVGAGALWTLSDTSAGQKYVLVEVGLCALFGGFTVLSTKAISTLLSREWLQIFKEWITYPLLVVLIGTGVGQIRYLNRALMKFDSKVVIPTQFVLFNLSAIVGSAMLYRDFDDVTLDRFVVFLYGCATTFVGVILLTHPVGLGGLGQETPSSSPPPSPNSTTPNVNTPLISPRSVRASDTPSLRGRSSTASLGLSPAYLLLASGSPQALSGPLVAVPIKPRTRSESRTRHGRRTAEGEPGSPEDHHFVGPSSIG